MNLYDIEAQLAAITAERDAAAARAEKAEAEVERLHALIAAKPTTEVWFHSLDSTDSGFWVVHQRGGNRRYKCGYFETEEEAVRLRDSLNYAWGEVVQAESERLRQRKDELARHANREAELQAENARLTTLLDQVPVMVAEQAEAMRGLQAQIEGHCARIASQSDAPGRVAEGSVTARLEAWAKEIVEPPGYRLYLVQSDSVYLDGHNGRDYCRVQAIQHGSRAYIASSTNLVVVGTDAESATLDQLILAALAEWEKLYGK